MDFLAVVLATALIAYSGYVVLFPEKAQADALKAARSDTMARVVQSPGDLEDCLERVSSKLVKGDLVLVKAGELIPADGEMIQGVASVDESAITGESAPVIRESGGDRSGVTGGTRVLSDWLVIRVEADPGEGFVDRMIGLIEGAKRQKTPNEIAAGFSLIFLLVCLTLAPFAAVASPGKTVVTATVLVALLVCLIPTTIGGLLSAIGIAGMDRLIQRNVIATSGSNLGGSNLALADNARGRIEALGVSGPVPVDLVTSSGSGLDPNISPAAARVQIPRVAKATGISPDDLEKLVARLTEPATFGILGQPRVNVVLLNVELKKLP